MMVTPWQPHAAANRLARRFRWSAAESLILTAGPGGRDFRADRRVGLQKFLCLNTTRPPVVERRRSMFMINASAAAGSTW